MGRIRLILLFVCVCFGVIAKANDTAYQLVAVNVVKGDFKDFNVDNLGNIYLMNSSGDQIKKLGDKLDSLAVYNDVKRYGSIYSIDVSNPLKVLVYYKDFATIVVLDRQLNFRNVIDLRKENILQVRAIAQSYDNNIWLFDELDSKIKKVDDNGKVLMESSDFRVLFDENTNPTNIIDANGLLHLYNARTGWLVFDYYGAMKNKYSIEGWKDVQVIDKILTGRDSVYVYSSLPSELKLLKAKPNVPLNDAIKVIVKQQRCYILKKDGLEIYKPL